MIDCGVGAGLKLSRRRPMPAGTPGLREARVLIAAPLSAKVLGVPQFGRTGLVAFWDDDEAIDLFEAENPLAEDFAAGWSVRLDPTRAVSVAGGHFAGIPADIPGPGTPDHDGPAVVLTIGRLRKRRVVSFLRTSAGAEAQVAAAPGMLWATGLANVPQGVVATLSLWETAASPHAYATTTSGHKTALRREGEGSFHHAGSFVRFRPYAARGHLPGSRNPLPDAVTAALTR